MRGSLIAAAALIGGCAPTEADFADRRALAEARPVGPAVDCVTLTHIRSTRVRDEQTIDFMMRGGAVLRNRLPYQCSGLRFENSFSYKTSIGRLCSADLITIQRAGGIGGPSCGLGNFQPIALPRR